jgi:hypothetical protein
LRPCVYPSLLGSTARREKLARMTEPREASCLSRCRLRRKLNDQERAYVLDVWG